MIHIETEVFIFAGFLGSGKTTALQGSIIKNSNVNSGKTIIICTEEGEEEYRTDELIKLNIDQIFLENESDLTVEFLSGISDKYKPERVFVEFNGMWNLKTFLEMDLPENWYVANVFSFVDAGTYELYLKNMRQTIMEPLKESDVILFNRCGEDFIMGNVRRSLKLLNSRAAIYFSGPDGKIIDGKDELYIDKTANSINITDDLFCSWFVDCMENPDKYYGKKVHVSGVVTKGKELNDNQFYVGRYAAICCAADARFVGFIAEYEGEVPTEGEWIEVDAQIEKGLIDGRYQIILLKITKLKTVKAPEDIFLYY